MLKVKLKSVLLKPPDVVIEVETDGREAALAEVRSLHGQAAADELERFGRLVCAEEALKFLQGWIDKEHAVLGPTLDLSKGRPSPDGCSRN